MLRLYKSKGPEMKRHMVHKGLFSLAVLIATVFIVTTPLSAAANDAALADDAVVNHDYILDRQESFSCSMVALSDEEMSDTVAAGFSKFGIDGNVVRAQFNSAAQTFTEIESLKMGYYDDGLGLPNSLDWDQNWLGVSLGSSTTPLICDGLFIEARFTNIGDRTTRTLETLRVGTPSMTGPISADFVSFSGRIYNPTDGELVNGHRLNLGTRTITSTNSEFYMQLSTVAVDPGQSPGWWFSWDNATITP